jgi:hypothetical protein
VITPEQKQLISKKRRYVQTVHEDRVGYIIAVISFETCNIQFDVGSKTDEGDESEHVYEQSFTNINDAIDYYNNRFYSAASLTDESKGYLG